MSKFSGLDVGGALLKSLDSLGYQAMTEIQSKALPDILSGRDVIAQAETGSGKTVAFGLGVLESLVLADAHTQSLILCPTRELSHQVAAELRKLGRFYPNLKVLTLCGGAPIRPQIASLEHGAHIIVGTPGRVLDHLGRRTVDIRQVNTLVLDEADRMLDMGFGEDIRKIIGRAPKSRQTLLFSATFPDSIEAVSRGIQSKPVTIKTPKSTHNADIEQHFFETKKDEALENLYSLIAQYKPQSSIVFCTTKIQCREVARFLNRKGLSALAIHGDLEQSERDEAMVRFANQSVSFLVATDVAARGLDVKDLPAVINFEISRDPEVHVHRVGRTGRAGAKGLALTMYNRSEVFRLKAVEKEMGQQFNRNSPLVKTSRPVRLLPPMTTLKIYGGKKDKLRPGDVLGALTKDAGIAADNIGKINIFATNTYVAIKPAMAESALRNLMNTRIKNRRLGMRIIR